MRLIDRVLVTGGTGFIGSHVAEYYAKKGGEVIVLDNLSRAEILGMDQKVVLHNWNHLKNNYGNVKLIKGDVRDFEKVKEAAGNVDAIIHAAAQVAVTASLADPRTDFEINALGTFNALEAARLNDATLILCSTNKVYGENVNKIPLIEHEKHYSFSDEKYREGEYGRAISRFIAQALKGEDITVYGDGSQTRSFCYITDAILGILKIATSHKAKGETINIGSPHETRIIDLAHLVKRLTNSNSEITLHPLPQDDPKRRSPEITKAKYLLNWQPKVPLEEGLNKTIEWFRLRLRL